MSIFAFGHFTLDTQAAELRRGDARVSLRPKCFDLLVVFVENRGLLLTKEKLLQTVWSDVVVTEAALTRTIAELREVLGDDAESPAYIETVPRRGYRFIAPVTESDSQPADESPSNFCVVHGAKQYPLHEGDQLIGRGEDVDIPVFSTSVSRHHACIHVAGDRVTIEDLSSRNGTFVKGHKVRGKVPLQIGDQIGVGAEVLILITVWLPTAETTPAPDASS